MQRKVLAQSKNRKLVVADTMNLWIETQRDELYALLEEIDGLVLNDGEARMLTEEVNLVRAGREGAGARARSSSSSRRASTGPCS